MSRDRGIEQLYRQLTNDYLSDDLRERASDAFSLLEMMDSDSIPPYAACRREVEKLLDAALTQRALFSLSVS